MRKCSVVGCESYKRNTKIPMFRVPINYQLDWNKAVQLVNNQKKLLNFVCLEHFSPDDVNMTYSLPSDVTFENNSRQIFTLKKGVIPSVFKNVFQTPQLFNLFKKESNNTDHQKKTIGETKVLHQSQIQYSNPHTGIQITKIFSFSHFLQVIHLITLPNGWLFFTNENAVTIYTLSYKNNFEKLKLAIEKQIVFNQNLDIDFYIYQRRVQLEFVEKINLNYPFEIEKLTKTIQYLNSKEICQGGPAAIDFPGIFVKKARLEDNLWRHIECFILINENKRCVRCKNLFSIFRTYKWRSKNNANKKKQIKTTKKTRCLSIVEKPNSNSPILENE